jgi:hypothetical protein
MATTKTTIADLSRQIQNKSARARIKVLLDALCTAYDSVVAGSAGFLTADTAGRAVMATGYFIAATVLDKFAAGSIDATAAASIFADAAIPSSKLQTVGAPDTKSGSGVTLDITKNQTQYTTTGAGNTAALPNGTYAGQRHVIFHAVKGSSGSVIITPATGQHTSVTLTDVYASVEFIWNGTTWAIGRLVGSGVTVTG